MLKVGIYWDLRATIPERHTGVGQHVIEVLNRLRARSDCEVRVLVAKDQMELWERQSEVFDWSALDVCRLPLSNKGNRLLYGITSMFGLDRICTGCDVVYSPMELLLGFKEIPFVNTIHGIPCFEQSLPHEVHSSLRYRWERVKQAWFFRRCHRLCQQSFPVSEYLKERLIDPFKFEPSRLHSVYNGAADLFFEPSTNTDETCVQAHPSFLSVGGANAYDGGAGLLQIARLLEQQMPSAEIRIIGDRHEEPWYSELCSMPNVVWLGFLESTRVVEEMRRSTALLYVPAVESFGIIGVEAMAVGLPILALPSTALPEVLGDAVRWIDLSDDTDLSEGLKRVVEDDVLREELISKGRARAERYRWSQVVDRVIAGFERALKR